MRKKGEFRVQNNKIYKDLDKPKFWLTKNGSLLINKYT